MSIDETVADRPTSLVGGRYRLGRRLGSGGMADVFAAEDHLLSRSVAVKVFRVDASPEERNRIDGEIRTLASMRHPGLVTVYDAGVDEKGSTPYLVMELIDGPTLRQRLNQSALSQAETARLGAELSAALSSVHARGIVHRDVKPANILLDPDPDPASAHRAKLADFGISRALTDDRITTHGTTVGTANYLSPEQAQGFAVGPASDVYSLGLVLIECLTGQVVYPGSGVEAAVLRLHAAPAAPALPGEHGQRWQGLLRAMTRSDPNERPTADEVERELADLRQVSTMSPVSEVSSAAATAVLATAPSGSTAVLAPSHSSHSSHAVRRTVFALAALIADVLIVSMVSPKGSARHPVTPTTHAAQPVESQTPSAPAKVIAATPDSRTAPTRTTTPPGKAKSVTSPATKLTPPHGSEGSQGPQGSQGPPGPPAPPAGGPGKGHGKALDD